MTEGEADKMLETLMDENQKYIELLVNIPLTQKQYDSLVSIMYNKGYGNFVKSDIYKFIKVADYINTSKAILKDGEEHNVENRRKKEYENFIYDFPFNQK